MLTKRKYSLNTVKLATSASLFMQWFIVFTGSTVRLTGSGLGCPNWPTCTKTRPIPELSFHPMVEFLNRMTAAPTLIAALIALWVCWRIDTEKPRLDLRIASAVVVLGILAQAIVGALTVILELPPEIVSTHFIISIILLISATFAWIAARDIRPLKFFGSKVDKTTATVALTMLTTLFAVIVVGMLTTASGPHTGASGTGQQVDRLHIFGLAVTLHARGAYIFMAALLFLTWKRWKNPSSRGPALADLLAVVALVVLQITLGEIQYRNELPWAIVLAHVVNAALLWIFASRAAIYAVFSRT